MRRIVFFSTITGLQSSAVLPITAKNNWPRIIQIAISVYLESDTVGAQKIKSKEFLIKPDGWEVPDLKFWLAKGMSQDDAEKKAKFWVDNGFSQEKSESEGVPILDALHFFKFHLQQADLLVAHNMNFDSKILGAEMLRAGFSTGVKVPKFCTMMATIDYCRLPFPNGGNGFKFPKLEELYEILFERKFDGAHQASIDTEACAECYFELLKRGLI